MKPRAGMKISEAVARTGMTEWQLRGLIRRGEIRHRRVGSFVLVHPEDVDRMCTNTWRGRPFTPPDEAAKGGAADGSMPA